MKIKHKEFIIGLILGGIIFGSFTIFAENLFNVTINPFKIKVNGTECSIEGYNINGNSYFKLRDIGEHIGFDVDFKEETILIETSNNVLMPEADTLLADNEENIYISMIENMLKNAKPSMGLMKDDKNIGYYYADLNLILKNVIIAGNYTPLDSGDTYYLQLINKTGDVIIENLDSILVNSKLCITPSFFVNTILPLDN